MSINFYPQLLQKSFKITREKNCLGGRNGDYVRAQLYRLSFPKIFLASLGVHSQSIVVINPWPSLYLGGSISYLPSW